MAAKDHDRNLLFGILALQMDFISRGALVAAMHAWVMAKDKPLGEILVEQKALAADRRTLLEALVQEHLKQHDNDPEKSLAAVSSLGSAREDLRQIADPDVQATLAQVAAAHPPVDAGTTQSFAVGSATSAGTRFRILRPHAEGGLGKVSVARDEELSREVALKEIKERHADNVESRARFLLEAEITGGLEHPGIVPVYGLGQYADGRPYYAMRFIRGDSLKEAADRYHHPSAPESNPGERAVELRKLLGRFLNVCNAIAYAHSRGVLHRDLKPGNIMLGKYGETLVVDWGLAKVVDRPEVRSDSSELPISPSSGSGAAVTQMGAALGTPHYMSPEQAAGRWDLLGPASDVYSLGATLYYVLTGRRPIEANDIGTVLQKVQRGEFRSPRTVNPGISRPLEAICLKAMALKPENRYATPKALADDIEHWLADEPVVAYREPLRTRAARWGRKHKTLVAGSFGLVTAAAIALAVSSALIQQALTRTGRALAGESAARAEADSERTIALEKTREADTRRQQAEDEKRKSEQNLYYARIALAYQRWLVAAVDEADQTLEACPIQLRGWEWGYLKGLCHLDLITFHGHSWLVRSVAFSPDGKWLATGSWDGTAKIWNATDGRELFTLRGRGDAAAVAFSPDGKRLAAGDGSTANIWDTTSGQKILELRGHSFGATVCGLAFSADGKQLATGSLDGTAKIWDATSGQELHTLRRHSDRVFGVAFSPDGKRLATGSTDDSAKIWDATKGEELLTFRGASSSVAFSPDGKRLATGSAHNTATIWDASSGQELLTLHGHAGTVISVAFSPDGKRLATGSWDKTAKIWDATSGQEQLTLHGHSGTVNSVAFSPDGKRLATGSDDMSAKIWDAMRDREVLTLRGVTENGGSTVAFSPDGKLLVTRSQLGGTEKIWDATSGEQMPQGVVAFSRQTPAGNEAFSADGKWRATASGENAAKICDAASGQEVFTLRGHSKQISSMAFSPDGRRLATGSWDETTKIWDVTSGQEVFTLRGHHVNTVTSVVFSPDGKRLATGNEDGTANIWGAAVLAGAEQATDRARVPDALDRNHSEIAPEKPIAAKSQVNEDHQEFAKFQDTSHPPTSGDNAPPNEQSSSNLPSVIRDYSQTLIFYYQKPEPGLGSKVLAELLKAENIDHPWFDEHSYVLRVIIPAQLGDIARGHPEIVRQYEDAFLKAPKQGQLVILAALGNCGDEVTRKQVLAWKTQLKDPELERELAQLEKNLADPNRKHVRDRSALSPDDLDLLWVNFSVTGEYAPIARILDVLDLPDVPANSMLRRAALWSLTSNLRQHSHLLDVVRKHLDERPEKSRRQIDQVLAQVDPAAAITEIEKLGGEVTVDEKMPGKPVIGVDLSGANGTDAALEHVERFTELRSLRLHGAPVTDAGLEHLMGLTQIETLALDGTRVTDAGLEHLMGLTQIETLALDGTRVTDAGLEHLKGLTQMHYLYLDRTRVTDAGLEHIKGLTQIRSLHIDDTQVTDAGLEHLKGLTQIGDLQLRGTQVTDAGLERLKGLTQLRMLELNGTQVTGAGLEYLKGLTQFRTLILRGAPVTDAGLEHIKDLAQVTHLDLRGTKVTDAGLAHLKSLTQLSYLGFGGTHLTGTGLEHLKGLRQLEILDLSGAPVTDAGLEHLKGLTQLMALGLNGTSVTDAGLERLKGLAQLQFLALADTLVTDGGLEHLKGLTQLRMLELNGTQVTGAGLEYLKGLKQLHDLHLGGTLVTGAGLEHLKGLTQIHSLGLGNKVTLTVEEMEKVFVLPQLPAFRINGIPATDAGLEHLKGLTQLTALDLGGAPVTDAGLAHLKGLTQLQWLELNSTQVTDAGLEHLKRLTQLQFLGLGGTPVTDVGLEHLKGLTQLQFLDLRGAKVTDEGVKKLQTALPKCTIRR